MKDYLRQDYPESRGRCSECEQGITLIGHRDGPSNGPGFVICWKCQTVKEIKSDDQIS